VSAPVALFWITLIGSVLLFMLGQFVTSSTLRSALLALSLGALVATGLMGAAWATTSS
jgi:hypothetical protein